MTGINGETIDFFFSESNTNGKYTYASDNFVKIDGRSVEELLDMYTKSIRHDDVPQYILDEMYDWPRAKGYWDGILKNVNKNGSAYWIKASIIKIHHNGETFFGMVSVPATNEEIKKAQKDYIYLKSVKYDQTTGRKALQYPLLELEQESA
jgi:PAS domain S-box-containing protein